MAEPGSRAYGHSLGLWVMEKIWRAGRACHCHLRLGGADPCTLGLYSDPCTCTAPRPRCEHAAMGEPLISKCVRPPIGHGRKSSSCRLRRQAILLWPLSTDGGSRALADCGSGSASGRSGGRVVGAGGSRGGAGGSRVGGRGVGAGGSWGGGQGVKAGGCW